MQAVAVATWEGNLCLLFLPVSEENISVNKTRFQNSINRKTRQGSHANICYDFRGTQRGKNIKISRF